MEKSPLNNHTEKLQPTHNHIHFGEKFIPKFCSGKRGRYSHPAHIHCFLPCLDQMVVWKEALLHSSSMPEKMSRGRNGVLSFTDSFWFWQIVSHNHPVPVTCSLGSDRAALPEVSTHAHVRLSVKSPWFSNSCGFTAVKTETSYDCLPDCIVTK